MTCACRVDVNDYIPEPAWTMWDEMASEGCFPTCGVTGATFLANYRSVYAQLRPRTSVQHVERPSSMSGALPPWGMRAAVGCLPLRG